MPSSKESSLKRRGRHLKRPEAKYKVGETQKQQEHKKKHTHKRNQLTKTKRGTDLQTQVQAGNYGPGATREGNEGRK